MNWWESVLLGIIQGITEFLPISSTAHLLVARQLMGHAKPSDSYTTVIQLGTLVAVLIYFRQDIFRLLKAFLGDVRQMRYGTSVDSRLCWKIVLGTLPVVICGFTLKDFIKGQLYNSVAIAIAAIVFGFILLEAEIIGSARRRRYGNGTGKVEAEITWGNALFIGCFQALALIPGASRSGCTISAALLAGLSRPTAARFSFILSLPAIAGAGLYEAYKERKELMAQGDELINLALGLIVSTLVGYASIAWLLKFMNTNNTLPFVVYRIIIGTAMLILVNLKLLA